MIESKTSRQYSVSPLVGKLALGGWEAVVSSIRRTLIYPFIILTVDSIWLEISQNVMYY